MLKQRLKNFSLFTKLWLLAPVVIWFSYYPTIRLAEDTTTYYELSLTVIFIAALSLVGLPIIWKAKERLLKQNSVRLLLLFFFINMLSLLWTANFTRGLLTVGLLGVICLVFMASLARAEELRQSRRTLVKSFIISSVVMTGLAIIQMVAAVWLSSDMTLLCRGCVAEQFGFARPNVFSIEPQFFGNMLLAPSVILFHLLLQRQFPKLLTACFVFVSLGLFLTMSRGAIISFGAGVIILTLLHHAQKSALLKVYALLALSFLTGLLIQGSVAAVNPKLNTTFNGAISASINQLTLGTVDLSAPDNPEAIITSNQNVENDKSSVAEQQVEPVNDSDQPLFEGYVEESTNVRLALTQLSLNSWSKSIDRMLLGVGTGGSGVVLQDDFPERVNPREIVQNQYAEVLLENGLIGFVVFISIIGALFYSLRNHKWSWAVLGAFLVQWNFFSGYPNALHIYLICIGLFVIYKAADEHIIQKRTS